MNHLFGTDGVRGIANRHPMTAEIALALGRASAHVLNVHAENATVVIGKDTRLSCYMIEHALSAGFCSMGVNVLLVGPMPTPAVAYLVRTMKCGAGVVISASHNLFQDNGIKFFSKSGFKLDDKTEEEIEENVSSNHLEHFRPTADHVGKIKRIDDAQGRYIEFVKATFPDSLSLSGLKIVVDCAHGAAYKVAPLALSELGANIISLGVSPDGTNINLNCGSTSLETIRHMVLENGAHIGIALDGDGDRAIFIDEKGEVVDGDEILAICANAYAKEGLLRNKVVVGTVMSNFGLEVTLAKIGIDFIRADVGDRYVVAEMKKRNCQLGGEPSGHLLFLDKHTTGDGLVSALQIMRVMQASGKSLSVLKQIMKRFPQVLKNHPVNQKKPIQDIPHLTEEITAVQKNLGNSGRILVRYSGTETKIRVMVEGESEQAINQYADKIIDIFKEQKI